MPENDWDELDRLNTEQANDSHFRELDRALVPGEGSDNPIAFIIGPAPGAQEALRGRSFVGVAGIVQRMLMSHAGLYPSGLQRNCWLTSAIKFRPPRNRKPYWIEILAARPYLLREWRAVGAPSLIITIGETALSAVLGRQTSVLKMSGKLHISIDATSGSDRPPLFLWPMIHPSFGLRQPAMRTLIEKDWARLAEWMRDANYA